MSNPGSGERLPDVVSRLEQELADLRRSRRRLAVDADADRRAIERAFHDGLQQRLVALSVDLRRLTALMETNPLLAKQLLDGMTVNVREAIEESTALAERIYPPLLEVRGFASAMRTAAESAGLTVLVDVSMGADSSAEVTAALYWTCVEVLAWASHGSQATITVRATDGVIAFEVIVDGQPVEAGLLRLRDRIQALDGAVNFDVRQDGGSRIHGWLPLSR